MPIAPIVDDSAVGVHNATGNEITMVRRHTEPEEGPR